MNRKFMNRIAAALFICSMFFMTFDAMGAEGLNPAIEGHDKDKRGTISVQGEAKEFFAPDTVMIRLSVETNAKTANDAVIENAKRAEKVIQTLKALIGPSDSIKTSSYTLQPVYEYDNIRKKSALTGYSAINEITVRSKRIEIAGKIIDGAIVSGANSVQHIEFLLADEKVQCETLLKKAAKNAEVEASMVAGALGAKISGIKSIAPACGSAQPQPVFRAAMMRAMEAGAPETAIEAGDLEVNASVSVVFYVGQ